MSVGEVNKTPYSPTHPSHPLLPIEDYWIVLGLGDRSLSSQPSTTFVQSTHNGGCQVNGPKVAKFLDR